MLYRKAGKDRSRNGVEEAMTEQKEHGICELYEADPERAD
jgi:hypothetical protein